MASSFGSEQIVIIHLDLNAVAQAFSFHCGKVATVAGIVTSVEISAGQFEKM